jgi:CHASE2 domain-containing sensor protein/HD-GYP domain-containing protein (c-di-GMP phosphodiesterase class II)
MEVRKQQLLRWLKRIFATAQGRPFAAVLLAVLLLLNVLGEMAQPAGTSTEHQFSVGEALYQPSRSARTWVFDHYQKWHPRIPQAQPITIVAIDEQSLDGVGQWPWPRNKMAALIDAINSHGPVAIGLDIYMPEPDGTSPDKLAQNLPPERADLAAALKLLPSNDSVLAQALRDAPSVLGAAGFDFQTYTTKAGMRSLPVLSHGTDALPHVRQFANVLVSLPELQAAAQGQALLSVDTREDAVRRIPLLAAVGVQLVPGLAMEMLRVATRSKAVEVTATANGVQSVQVADLSVPTQASGDIWLHFAKQSSGLNRYVSAQDVLQGKVDKDLLEGKLVLIGLTGAGLNDMRTTGLGELVPGIEIQAQVIEALFDGSFLLRPWWMKWVETLLVGGIGLALVWFVPRTHSRLAAMIRNRPQLTLALVLLADALFLLAGYVLFSMLGILCDVSAFVIVFTVITGSLIGSGLIEGMGEARTRLARLVDNGIMLGREHDRNKLLRQTLLSAKEMTHCFAATLYLKTEGNSLVQAMRSDGDALTEAEIALFDSQGAPNHRLVAPHVVLTGKTVVIDDIWSSHDFDTDAVQQYSKDMGKRVVSILNVPLQAGEDKVIGVLQLMNALDSQTGEPIAFDPKMFGFVEALAAQAAAAIENRNLLEAQTRLMDSMIQIIAGAIDTKSPYTGGHCERVPDLAIMLAQKACAVQEGPLADFAFKNDDEWREFRIGAWLHDCGKVTTPEYVVDKATKLETIYNRLHEVRMRFEVLLRDAQIERLQARQAGGDIALQADAALEARKAQLLSDFAFVADCNAGGEFMAPDKIERLQRIAAQTWWRHFDDRLGLSHEELARHEREPITPPPALEKLLADKTNHLFERSPSKDLDEKYGFKLKVPEHLYNHGEVYNLSVARGTLTEEERFKINEHIIQTIVMLEQMPLPPGLKRIPEYAGTHHETLIGTGYPRKLTADQLSVPSRIMVIADIFEALTSSDRPYKKAKTLSECVKILFFCKKDKHIDPALFDLFLTSGVYKSYAEKYLRPDQIDEVDIAQYVS